MLTLAFIAVHPRWAIVALGSLVTIYIHIGTAAILVTDKDQSNKPLFLLHMPDREFSAMIGPVISEKKMFDEC